MVEAHGGVRGLWAAAILILTLALPASVLASTLAQTPAPEQAMLRLVQASTGSQPVDMLLGSRRLFCSLPFRGVTRYANVPAGAHDVRIVQSPEAGTGTPAAATPGTERLLTAGSTDLAGGTVYSALLVGPAGGEEVIVLRDDLSAPPAGQARVRFVNLSPNAMPLDLARANEATVATGISYRQASDYNTAQPGTAELQVVETDTGNVLATMPDVNVVAGVVYTVYAVGMRDGEPPLQMLVTVESAGGMPVTMG